MFQFADGTTKVLQVRTYFFYRWDQLFYLRYVRQQFAFNVSEAICRFIYCLAEYRGKCFSPAENRVEKHE